MVLKNYLEVETCSPIPSFAISNPEINFIKLSTALDWPDAERYPMHCLEDAHCDWLAVIPTKSPRIMFASFATVDGPVWAEYYEQRIEDAHSFT